MPVYEFYCGECHTIFQFFARTINLKKRPDCPRPDCPGRKLERRMSAFAITGKAKEPGDELDDLPVDEAQMERAMMQLAGDAENVNEDDPRAAAQLMRRFAGLTGLEMGKGMREALARMEAGEDPDEVERDMGDVLDQEDPFLLGKGSLREATRVLLRGAPRRDETLYDL